MISLSNLFKQEIITETIVDHMFDSLQAHIIHNDIEQAEKDIEDFAAKLHVRIHHKVNNNISENIQARTRSFGTLAQITIVRKRNVNTNTSEYLQIMIHELAHAIFIMCFSFEVDEKTYIRLTLSDIVEATGLNYNDLTVDNSLKYLQYIFDFREWSPMAFTVAYGAYKSDNFDDIVKSNQKSILEFLDNVKSEDQINKVKTIVKNQGEFLSVLFNVQLAMYFLKDKSDKYIKYKTKVAKFIKLVSKYQKRLIKLVQNIKGT